MKKYHIVVAKCDRYEVEAETEEAALKQIQHEHYSFLGDLRNCNQVDFWTSFKSEGEVVDFDDDDEDGEHIRSAD